MSQILDVLFGSREKARLIKFFLLNNDKETGFSEVIKKTMLSANAARRDLAALVKIRLVLARSKKGSRVYRVNQDFSFYPELRNLITKSNVYPECQSLKKIHKIGRVKLASISGVFINYPKSKADMLLVVDDVTRGKLSNLMASVEAEVGREINYVLMNSDEFKYRLNMLDKFVMEFFECPHEDIVNKFRDAIRKILASRT